MALAQLFSVQCNFAKNKHCSKKKNKKKNSVVWNQHLITAFYVIFTAKCIEADIKRSL